MSPDGRWSIECKDAQGTLIVRHSGLTYKGGPGSQGFTLSGQELRLEIEKSVKAYSRGAYVATHKRGFTIRLKRLKPRAPDFEGPQHFGSRKISSISVSIIFVFLFWFNARFLTTPLTKDIYRRMSMND